MEKKTAEGLVYFFCSRLLSSLGKQQFVFGGRGGGEHVETGGVGEDHDDLEDSTGVDSKGDG